MRRIMEVLRLAAQGLSYRQIGQSVGISRNDRSASSEIGVRLRPKLRHCGINVERLKRR